MNKSYSELIKLKTFEERYRYLKLSGKVGDTTFGHDRYLNQIFYNTPEWKRLRHDIIVRDNGCDLGISDRSLCPHVMGDRPKTSNIYIHHINPITKEDILKRNPCIFDPENMICCSYNTHQAIHYGDERLLDFGMIVRVPNDTCPWR